MQQCSTPARPCGSRQWRQASTKAWPPWHPAPGAWRGGNIAGRALRGSRAKRDTCVRPAARRYLTPGSPAGRRRPHSRRQPTPHSALHFTLASAAPPRQPRRSAGASASPRTLSPTRLTAQKGRTAPLTRQAAWQADGDGAAATVARSVGRLFPSPSSLLVSRRRSTLAAAAGGLPSFRRNTGTRTLQSPDKCTASPLPAARDHEEGGVEPLIRTTGTVGRSPWASGSATSFDSVLSLVSNRRLLVRNAPPHDSWEVHEQLVPRASLSKILI